MSYATTVSVSDPPTAEGRFGLAELTGLLRRRGTLIRNVTLAVVGLTALALLLWPSSYSTTAVVMLDARKNNVADLSQVLAELPTDPSSVQNQIQILTSRDLAGQVIDRLDLTNDPEFNAALGSRLLHPLAWFAPPKSAQAQRTGVVDVFLKHLTAEGMGLSTAVSVSFTAREPDKSARVVNAVVDAYIASQVAQKSDAARQTTSWLISRIAELGRDVQNAEANVQAYKARNGLNDAGEGTQSLVEQQLAAINEQLVDARADLAEKQANYDHITSLVQSGHAADVSQVVSSPLIVQLRGQQADAIRADADLASRYGPRHPKRLAAESQKRDLDTKIDLEVQRIAGSVANDVAVARAQVKSLETSLGHAQQEDNAQNLARVRLKALEANAASTRSMYEAFVVRLRETQDQGGITLPDARVISHASAPVEPTSPPRFLIFAASIPAGFLLGLLCALLMERAGLELPLPVARNLEPRRKPVPIVGYVPDAASPVAADLVITAPHSGFARALSAIAAQLMSQASAIAPMVVLVTAIDPREGRSSVAIGLARTLATLNRKVVVLDADLRAATAAWSMGIPPRRPDLLDALRKSAPLNRAAIRDPRSPALVLRAVEAPRNPQALWSSQELRALLVHLKRSVEFVIIDGPPVSAVETRTIAALSDAVLVVGFEREAQALRAVASTIAAAQSAAVGIVHT
ncbi:MAG TPA: exopolysaccharide transport family protein [Rhizomicrobium sp.]